MKAAPTGSIPRAGSSSRSSSSDSCTAAQFDRWGPCFAISRVLHLHAEKSGMLLVVAGMNPNAGHRGVVDVIGIIGHAGMRCGDANPALETPTRHLRRTPNACPPPRPWDPRPGGFRKKQLHSISIAGSDRPKPRIRRDRLHAKWRNEALRRNGSDLMMRSGRSGNIQASWLHKAEPAHA